MSNLIIQQMEVGPMQNYIYFIGDKESKEIAIIDPAWDVEFVKGEAEKQGLKVVATFITHLHPDHNNGLGELLNSEDVPVFVSEKEASFYKPFKDNIKSVKPGDKFTIGKVEGEFLHTPGHTPGSQCFLVEGNLVAGDTLFIDGCGRCDLPGGDAEEMYDTLFNKLYQLPNSTLIYPGHNYHHKNCDTLGNQKETNRFLVKQTLQEFLRERMGL